MSRSLIGFLGVGAFLIFCFVMAGIARDNSRPMNIVLIVADTLAAKHMSLYGYERPTTPFLEKLAQDSFVFDQAYANASYTLPSHATLFTGRPVATHRMALLNEDDPQPQLPAEMPTLAERLKKKGYRTAWFAITTDPQLPLTGAFERGFDAFEWVAENAFILLDQARLGWMAANRKDPLFIFLHSYLVHDPYVPPRPYYRTFDPDYRGPIIGEYTEFHHFSEKYEEEHKPGPGENWKRLAYFSRVDERNPREVSHLEALYDEEILYLDKRLEVLVEQLKRHGLYDNTVLIFTADHGEAFKEHGYLTHQTLHHEVLHVPLLIRVPGLKPGRSSALVQLMDVLPTILDLTRQEVPRELEGRSLLPLLRGQETGSSHESVVAQIHPGPEGALQTSEWKFIRMNGGEELYKVKSDLFEKTNVIDQHPEIRDSLNREFEKYLNRAGN